MLQEKELETQRDKSADGEGAEVQGMRERKIGKEMERKERQNLGRMGPGR